MGAPVELGDLWVSARFPWALIPSSPFPDYKRGLSQKERRETRLNLDS